MKMEPIVSSETSAIRTQTPGNYPKRNNLHLEHGESLRTKYYQFNKGYTFCYIFMSLTIHGWGSKHVTLKKKFFILE